MKNEDVVNDCILALVTWGLTIALASWAGSAKGRYDPIEGSLELAYGWAITAVVPAILFAIGLTFVLHPLLFGKLNVPSLFLNLGIGGTAILVSVLYHGELRNCRVRLDSQGLFDGKHPPIRWDEIVRVERVDHCDLELRTEDGRKLIVSRSFVGFNDAIPLFLAYLREPARTQFGKLLVRN